MDELTALTRDLVSIPSHVDETAAGDAIEEWLRAETDAEVTRDDAGSVLAFRGNATGTRDADASRDVSARKGLGEASLALVGHHDVVPPAAAQTEEGEYVVYEEDGRLYGRGAADMKGAVAACMLAFRDSDPSCELVFASFVGEESGGTGARHAIDEGFAPDYAIVAEGSTNYSGPGATDVVVAHKGRRGSTITARGVACHASEPESGENAIYRASDAIDAVRAMEFPDVEVHGERLRGSIAATEIDGGSAMNVVPDTCTVTIDERTVPGERLPLESIADAEGVEWSVDQDLPPMACDDDDFAALVLESAVEAQAGDPQLVTKPHATDAGWLAGAGTTCVVCGASEPGQAHTKTESVGLDVLERCYRIYRNAAERL